MNTFEKEGRGRAVIVNQKLSAAEERAARVKSALPPASPMRTAHGSPAWGPPVPRQFGPEFALDIFRNPARHAGTQKNRCDALGPLVFRPDDKIAAAHMFYSPRFRHRSRNINDRRQRLDRCRRANLLDVVYPIL